jgi:hypothetical protein
MNAIQTIRDIHTILASFDDLPSLLEYARNPYVYMTYDLAFKTMLRDNGLTPPENFKVKEILSAFIAAKFPAQTFPVPNELSDAVVAAALHFASFHEVNAESIDAFVDYLVKLRTWDADYKRKCSTRIEEAIRSLLQAVRNLTASPLTQEQMDAVDAAMTRLRIAAKKKMTPEQFASIEAEIEQAGLFFSRTIEME